VGRSARTQEARIVDVRPEMSGQQDLKRKIGRLARHVMKGE
jgi:hypothetical protein